MRLCSTCRDKKEDLENEMIEIFETNNIQEISYELWETTERSKVVSHCQNYRDFVDMFLSKLEKYSSHKYEYQTQQKYYDNLKINLPPGKVLIAGDFAENLREAFIKKKPFFYGHSSIRILPPPLIIDKKPSRLEDASLSSPLYCTFHHHRPM